MPNANHRTLLLLSLWLGGCQLQTQLPAANSPLPLPPRSPTPDKSPTLDKPPIVYKTYHLPQAKVYSLQIPAQSDYEVLPAVAEGVETLETFVRQSGAIAAINGGFFDPVNQKSTSYITVQGNPVATPQQNERLMTNPDLQSYLGKILNRSEFRRYRCGTAVQYAIARYRDPGPANCQLVDALGAGPRLLPDLTAEAEGFVAMANGTMIRDSLGSGQPNARSAVGITHDGAVILVMVAQVPKSAAESVAQSGTNSGMSLATLATFMKNLGVKQAINLDGGTSSSLYYAGKTMSGKVDETGNFVSRPVKSVLLVRQTR